MFAQAVTCVRLLASLRWTAGPRLPAKRQAFVKRQIGIAHEGLSAISLFFRDSSDLIVEQFGPSFAERSKDLADALLTSRQTKKRFAMAHDLTGTLLNDLIPNFGEISERRKRSRELIEELVNCPVGRADWVRYEDICIKCIRFLFSSPSRLYTFKRELRTITSDGMQY
jgi:hypothetical protein